MRAPATYTATPFDAGLLQHRVSLGALVAVGLAPAGVAPRRWTVTRIARRRCAQKVVRVELVASIADLGFCDSRRLAGAVRRAMHESGLRLSTVGR